jgi:hypothetical protein
MANPENKLIDKRVVNRYVRKGIVEDKTYRDLLKDLPDLAEEALPVEASMGHAADFDDEDDDLDEESGAPAGDPGAPAA